MPSNKERQLQRQQARQQQNGIPSDEIQQLTSLVRADSWKMILSPLSGMSYQVSLTAWDHLQTCTGVDVKVIHDFVTRFRNHGPEQTPM